MTKKSLIKKQKKKIIQNERKIYENIVKFMYMGKQIIFKSKNINQEQVRKKWRIIAKNSREFYNIIIFEQFQIESLANC